MNLSRIFHCSVINVLCFAVVQQLLYLITEPSACQQLFYFSFLLPFSNFYILPEAKRFVNSFLRLFFAVLWGTSLSRESAWLYYHVSQSLSIAFYFLFSTSSWVKKEQYPKRKKRRKRDLNPRAAQTTYTLSRGASSASWVFLHVIFFMILSLRLTHLLLYWSVSSLSIINLKFLLLSFTSWSQFTYKIKSHPSVGAYRIPFCFFH